MKSLRVNCFDYSHSLSVVAQPVAYPWIGVRVGLKIHIVKKTAMGANQKRARVLHPGSLALWLGFAVVFIESMLRTLSMNTMLILREPAHFSCS
jgi:hypothetical protein